MDRKNIVFVVAVIAILLTSASYGLLVPNENKTKFTDSADIDGISDSYASDYDYSHSEDDNFDTYVKSSYYDYVPDDGLESAVNDGTKMEKIRMDTELKVPKGIVGKSHAKFNFIDERDDVVESVEMDFMSTVESDYEFDLILIMDGQEYSAKQIVSENGLEECNPLVVAAWYLGVSVLELLGIFLVIGVGVTAVVQEINSDGWWTIYTFTAGDGSRAILDLKVNTLDKVVRFNYVWSSLTIGNSTFYNSSENQAGVFRLAFITFEYVYMAYVTVNESLAKLIIRENKSSLNGGADIYTKVNTDAHRVTSGIGAGGGLNKHHNVHDNDRTHIHPDNKKPGIYFQHFHAVAKAKSVNTMNVHAFHGAPVVR